MVNRVRKKRNQGILLSSEFVSSFQSYFGVKKVKCIHDSSDQDWYSVRVIEEHKEIKEDGNRKNIIYYKIENKLWYYIFLFGTQLGEEPFGALFFSFWFWNLDACIGRKLVLVWNLVMYIGQYLKDLIQWDRPRMPDVVQLQTKWSEEYGMPSTHAMMGLAVPCSAFFFTLTKYQFPLAPAVIIICVWSLLVCSSRMYLGMHSLGDVVAGVVLTLLLLPPLITFVHLTDEFLTTDPRSPLTTLLITITSIIIFPSSPGQQWSASAATAVDVLGCYQGVILVGQWCLHYAGHISIINHQTLSLPIPVPDSHLLIIMMLRILVGGLVAVIFRITIKPVTQTILQQIFKESDKSAKYNTPRIISKFLTWLCVCFSVTCVSPLLFSLLGCQRDSSAVEHNVEEIFDIEFS